MRLYNRTPADVIVLKTLNRKEKCFAPAAAIVQEPGPVT